MQDCIVDIPFLLLPASELESNLMLRAECGATIGNIRAEFRAEFREDMRPERGSPGGPPLRADKGCPEEEGCLPNPPRFSPPRFNFKLFTRLLDFTATWDCSAAGEEASAINLLLLFGWLHRLRELVDDIERSDLILFAEAELLLLLSLLTAVYMTGSS
jgi:hypothetical protein